MGKLNAFLRPSPAGRTKEVFLEGFKDEGGNTVPFVVKCITPEENERISKKHMDENGRLDAAGYGNELIVACMVEPSLEDAELCKYYGTMNPTEVPGRMFTIGEKQLIQDAIMEINDLKEAKKKLNEAKNS